MGDYITLFEHTSRALKRIDPYCLVGGPETTSYEPSWTQELLSSSIQRGFDIDYLSFHQFEDPPTIANSTKLARRQYHLAKGIFPEAHIGEWGFEVKNAFLAQQHLACAEEAEVGFYCKDFFFERKWKCSVIDDNHMRKDMFYLLREYSKLGEKRIASEITGGLVKAIVGQVGKGVDILVGARGEPGEMLPMKIEVVGESSFELHSLEEITSKGLIKVRDSQDRLDKIMLVPQKAYLLKGEIK